MAQQLSDRKGRASDVREAGKSAYPSPPKKKKKEENAPERNYSGLSESVVAQSCLTLCNPMDCSLPGSSTHGIFQARILEWVANSFSRGTSQPRDWTLVSDISSTGRQVLYHYRHRERSIGTAWFLFFHYWYSIFPWMQCHFFFWLLLLSSLFSLL